MNDLTVAAFTANKESNGTYSMWATINNRTDSDYMFGSFVLFLTFTTFPGGGMGRGGNGLSDKRVRSDNRDATIIPSRSDIVLCVHKVGDDINLDWKIDETYKWSENIKRDREAVLNVLWRRNSLSDVMNSGLADFGLELRAPGARHGKVIHHTDMR